MPKSTICPVLLAALLLAGAGGSAHAQTYPRATVKLIVPVPAGGVTDTMARIVAQRLTEAWGHRSSSITVQAAIMPSARKR